MEAKSVSSFPFLAKAADAEEVLRVVRIRKASLAEVCLPLLSVLYGSPVRFRDLLDVALVNVSTMRTGGLTLGAVGKHLSSTKKIT